MVVMNTISLIAPRGNTLSVSAAGTGPTLILVHGFPLDQRMWRHQLAQLAQHYHVLAPDLRGFGRSTLSDNAYSLRELADDIDFIRQHLAADQPIALCGLSMGGYVAFEYWQHYRQHLSMLVLANTKPTGDDDAARDGRLKMAQAALESGAWPAVSPMLPKLLAEATRQEQPSVVEEVEAMMRSASADAIAAAQTAMAARADFSSSLPLIQVPTLVITGQADPIAPPAATEAWAQRIADSRYVCLADAGHLTPLEQPALFNQALLEFKVG